MMSKKLATDGIAMYICGAYLASKNLVEEKIIESKMRKIVDYYREKPIKDFKHWLFQLKDSLKSEEAFKKWVNKKYKFAQLPNDDYTLVFIQ